MSMKRTWAISSWISFLISVDIGRMRLGIERDCSDKDRRNPLGRMICGHDCCADLDDEPGNYCIAHRDAINLPLFQLTEEGVHLRLRRLRSVGYLTCDVEPATRLRQVLQPLTCSSLQF